MFKEIGISGIIDIAFMTFLIYLILMWFKKSRAAVVMTGMIIVAVIYFVAQQFNMILTAGVFQLFFAVILFAVVVIFQEEIRRFFEQIALWGFRRHRRRRQAVRLYPEEVETLVRTMVDLAHEKIGALIVIRGKSPIAGHLDAEIELNGDLSDQLIKSIFDPHSDGHDGAMIIEGNQAIAFGAHLPLSKNFKKLDRGGTRHAAALGISELSDALSLVVSEEKGTISYARHGEIRHVADAEALSHLIDRFYKEISPHKERTWWFSLFTKNYREKLIAIAIALVLWIFQVYGAKVVYETYTIPVEYAELAPDLAIESIEPNKVEVTFSGPRRVIYFVNKEKIRLFLSTLNLKPGTRTLKVLPSSLSFPKKIKLESIEPTRVVAKIKRLPTETEGTENKGKK